MIQMWVSDDAMTVQQNEQLGKPTERRLHGRGSTHALEQEPLTSSTEPQPVSPATNSGSRHQDQENLELSQEFKQQYLW